MIVNNLILVVMRKTRNLYIYILYRKK